MIQVYDGDGDDHKPVRLNLSIRCESLLVDELGSSYNVQAAGISAADLGRLGKLEPQTIIDDFTMVLSDSRSTMNIRRFNRCKLSRLYIPTGGNSIRFVIEPV